MSQKQDNGQPDGKQNERPVERPINRLCRDIGHDWTKTTAVSDYRTCQRDSCRAAQRLVRDGWRDVTASTPTRPCSQQPSPAVQPTLFAPGRDFPDPKEERRAELAYLRSLEAERAWRRSKKSIQRRVPPMAAREVRP